MRQAVVFVVASTAMVAVVAGAHVFVPLPESTSLRGVAAAQTAPLAPATSAPAKNAAIEGRNAPVPLLTREQRPARPATVEASAAAATPGPAANEEGNRFARSAIESDGYKAVRDITPGLDGTWRARAMRGRTEVTVTVDREGRVSAD